MERAQGSACTPEADAPQYLLALADHLQLRILQLLDVTALCSAAQTCTQLLRVASHPQLWPSCAAQPEDCVSIAARLCLASVLHVPPQVLHVSIDIKRSRRFPINISLHNLRPLLGVHDVEGLAEHTSRALQERASLLSKRLPHGDGAWRCWPPLAAMSIVRSDRASVRMAVRPAAVVPRLLSDMEGLGWPSLHMADTAPAGVVPISCSHATSEQKQYLQPLRTNMSIAAVDAGQQALSAGSSRALWLDANHDVRQARDPKGQLAAAVLASKALPHPSVARAHVLPHFDARPAGEQEVMADAAVQLMYAAAQASGISVSVGGQPGWTRWLDKCCMLVRQRQQLEELCVSVAAQVLPTATMEGCMLVEALVQLTQQACFTPAFDAAWSTATTADALLLLQLAGFKGAVTKAAANANPGELFTFAEATVGALVDWHQQSSKDTVLGVLLRAASTEGGVHTAEASHIAHVLTRCMDPELPKHSLEVMQQLDEHSRHALVRLRVILEALRVLQWCMCMQGAAVT